MISDWSQNHKKISTSEKRSEQQQTKFNGVLKKLRKNFNFIFSAMITSRKHVLLNACAAEFAYIEQHPSTHNNQNSRKQKHKTHRKTQTNTHTENTHKHAHKTNTHKQHTRTRAHTYKTHTHTHTHTNRKHTHTHTPAYTFIVRELFSVEFWSTIPKRFRPSREFFSKHNQLVSITFTKKQPNSSTFGRIALKRLAKQHFRRPPGLETVKVQNVWQGWHSPSWIRVGDINSMLHGMYVHRSALY